MPPAGEKLLELVEQSLDDDKAEDVTAIDLSGKTAIADYMVIASGTSARHVSSMAEKLLRRLKDIGLGTVPAEGISQGDWVLIDAGDVVVHIFRPEVRAFYDLEKMWGLSVPKAVGAAAVRAVAL